MKFWKKCKTCRFLGKDCKGIEDSVFITNQPNICSDYKRKIIKKKVDIDIFSGKKSVSLWESINKIKKVSDCKDALYFVCCKLQEFETEFRKSKRK
jgi:hypothetical protein